MLTVAYGVKLFCVKKHVYKWYKLFQDGREDALNDQARQQLMKTFKQ